MSALERLAVEVGVNERTLRRAVGLELIHAQRPSSRRLVLSDSEVAWVRSRWPVVSVLLAALRTEPNVELAVLFGSVAREADATDGSDIDILIELRRPLPGALEALHARLAGALGSDVELVPMRSAERDPHLLAEILRDGRPLVDRGDLWPVLQEKRASTQARARQEGRTLQTEARAAVGYFQRLATERAAPLPTGAGR
ncbi:MAG TPA: nucleotidyltransferase domain-containing protein [Solirubrobacteraceae bacterium]|nr:nucleotidyltransferase domain-containing protein [Solirubrobacteraceae bacterium]